MGQIKYLITLLLSLSSLLACNREPKPESNDLSFATLNQKLVNGVEITLVVTTSVPMQRTDFYLDGQAIGRPTKSQYASIWTPKDVNQGTHIISATSLTQQGNFFYVERTVTF